MQLKYFLTSSSDTLKFNAIEDYVFSDISVNPTDSIVYKYYLGDSKVNKDLIWYGKSVSQIAHRLLKEDSNEDYHNILISGVKLSEDAIHTNLINDYNAIVNQLSSMNMFKPT